MVRVVISFVFGVMLLSKNTLNKFNKRLFTTSGSFFLQIEQNLIYSYGRVITWKENSILHLVMTTVYSYSEYLFPIPTSVMSAFSMLQLRLRFPMDDTHQTFSFLVALSLKSIGSALVTSTLFSSNNGTSFCFCKCSTSWSSVSSLTCFRIALKNSK